MNELEELRSEISEIKVRNKRVESDKAWETSFTRRIVIAFGTYLTITIFLLMIGASYPYLAGLVPALAFILSTLTLPPLKEWWARKRR